MAANSSKSSGREKEVMWKSCSRATKPPLQIKLYGSKEGWRDEGRGGADRGEGKREREERRKSCRGKIRLCGLAPVRYVKPSCVPQGERTWGGGIAWLRKKHREDNN